MQLLVVCERLWRHLCGTIDRAASSAVRFMARFVVCFERRRLLHVSTAQPLVSTAQPLAKQRNHVHTAQPLALTVK